MSDTKTMVETIKLTRDYGPIRAVDQLSFSVDRGQIIGFLGPNGAGKTTTMKLITGYMQPTLGRVLIDGLDVHDNALAIRQKIGYLPENAPLYDDMMVDEFLEFVIQVRAIDLDKREARKREVIERCGIGGVLGKDIGQLSKGFRQRVGLAQAIIHDPEVLLLDEPTSGLDPNQIVEIRELIKELGKEKTVILSTHILPEVQATCNRVIIINNGRMVADDTPDALTAGQATGAIALEVATVSGSAPDEGQVNKVLTAVSGVRSADLRSASDDVLHYRLGIGDEDPRRALFKALSDNDLVIMHLAQEQVSLEETFRKLTLE